MSDPLRTDSSRAYDAASDSDRDAKIEQLLLVGLDHYFSTEYEQAINVWTRALFLDRNHPKARAYIERARSAQAEHQRESEELLQHGVAAFQRGDADEARSLLRTALSRGAPSEEAIVVLDRLSRLEAGAAAQRPAARPDRMRALPDEDRSRAVTSPSPLRWLLIVAIAVAGVVAIGPTVEWGSLLPLDSSPPSPSLTAPDTTLPLPRRGEAALMRARALSESGHLREALAALDAVKPTDPQKPEADQVRSRIQRELIALISSEAATPLERGKEGGRLP